MRIHVVKKFGRDSVATYLAKFVDGRRYPEIGSTYIFDLVDKISEKVVGAPGLEPGTR